MKRLVLIFGTASAAVAAIISIIDVAMTTSPAYPFSFGFGLLWGLPSLKLGRALGIQEGTSGWLWGSLEIGLNTALFFVAGALFGCVVYGARHLATEKKQRR